MEHNFNSRFGEIDIIAKDRDELCFIEVRYRKNTDFGNAAETIGTAKQQKIIKTAQYYLTDKPKLQNTRCRFDVIAMQGDIRHPEIDWLKNAFMIAT